MYQYKDEPYVAAFDNNWSTDASLPLAKAQSASSIRTLSSFFEVSPGKVFLETDWSLPICLDLECRHGSPQKQNIYHKGENCSFTQKFSTGIRKMIKRDAYLDKLVYAMGNGYLRLSENKYNRRSADSPIRLWLGRKSKNQKCPRSRRHFEHSFLCRKFPVKCRKNRPVAKYIGYLKDAFLVHSAQRFDIKGKRYIGSPLKFYFTDPGLRNSRLNFRQFEETHLMENVIYAKLLFRGWRDCEIFRKESKRMFGPKKT